MKRFSFLVVATLVLECILILLSGIIMVSRPSNMVRIPGGKFIMGTYLGMPNESPPHIVHLNSFWMDRFEVTNSQFLSFVKATHYVTVAEHQQTGMVFNISKESSTPPGWQRIAGADWRHPHGPDDSIDKKTDHPVVQITYHDALKYCRWLGKTLPTEAQFEYAARGGLKNRIYGWGNNPLHKNSNILNYWQGHFPDHNSATDGYLYTAPVGRFPANGYGLFDIAGNVWEWVSDWYHPHYYRASPRHNPVGPTKADSIDPDEPGIAKKIIRGGSFLCNDNVCSGFRPSARVPSAPDTRSNHIGFRCVKNTGFWNRIYTP